MPVASTWMPVLALAMPDAFETPAAHIRPSTGILLSFVPGIVSLRRPSAMAWQKARRCRTGPASRKSFCKLPVAFMAEVGRERTSRGRNMKAFVDRSRRKKANGS